MWLNEHQTLLESEFSLFPSTNKEKSLCHVAMLTSKISWISANCDPAIIWKKKNTTVWLSYDCTKDFSFIIHQYKSRNGHLCLERRTVEIQKSCYHGRVISRFSQLFVGNKDNILLYEHQWNIRWAFARKLDIFTFEKLITCYLHMWK